MKTNTKKLLSILLALMMMLSVVPFYASAADPIVLTRDNIVQWPTVTNLDGSTPKAIAYAGQKFNDIWTLKGGEVRYDANENGSLEDNEIIPGTFVFYDERILDDNAYIAVNFIPQDESTYTRIEKATNSTAMGSTGEVTVVTPEILEIPVATEVEANARLRTSTLTGGKAKHPLNGEEITYGEWAWTSSGKKVTASGYYPVEFFVSASFEIVTEYVLVRIKGDTSEIKMATSISELPAIEGAVCVGDKLSSLSITGGKVLGMNGEEVQGVFSFENDVTIAQAGEFNPSIIFTPYDSRYAVATARIAITVEKGNFAFLDENGAEIVPEITVPFGATMGDVQSALKGLTMNTKENIWFSFADGVKNTDKAATGTYNVVVRSYEDNSNYNETTLPVKVTVEQKELTLYGAYSAETKVLTFRTKEGIAPQGKFDIYVDGSLVKAGVAYGENVAYDAFTSSGVHTIKIVYIPTENDGYKIADFEIETQINLARNITAGENTGSISAKINGQNGHIGGESLIVCGDTIELSTIGGEAFLGWKIADKNGNIADLGIADLKATVITFAMPDYDIVVTAEYEKQEENNNSDGGLDIDSIFGGLDMDELTQGDSEWAIINIIRNLIAKFKSFLQQLIEAFQSIGD